MNEMTLSCSNMLKSKQQCILSWDIDTGISYEVYIPLLENSFQMHHVECSSIIGGNQMMQHKLVMTDKLLIVGKEIT